MRGRVMNRSVGRWVAMVGVLVVPLTVVPSPTEAVARAALSFPCRYAPRKIICTLSGHHFHAHERVQIVYTVFASPAQGAPVVGIYRRKTVTDARGSFTRPPFWAYVNPHTGFAITVVVSGAKGDHANTAVGGAP